jgi:hypothetical protein
MDSAIDEQQIRGMAITGATDQEIADAIGWTVADLIAKFGAAMKQTRAKRAVSLRRKQSEVAFDGSTSMLSHLGRCELGQSDRSGDANDFPSPLDPKVG